MPFTASLISKNKNMEPGLDDDNVAEHDVLLPPSKMSSHTPKAQPPRTRYWVHFWRCVNATSLVLVLFITYVFVNRASQGTAPRGQYLHCGHNAEEARALGCRFELMSFSWLPEPCIDQELEDEFVSLGFEYFEDMNDTSSRVPHELVVTGEHIVYSSWGEHMWHCSFMWRKMLRIANGIKGSGGFSEGMLRVNHTEHCTSKMMEEHWEKLDTINTKGTPVFGECMYDENPPMYVWGRQ